MTRPRFDFDSGLGEPVQRLPEAGFASSNAMQIGAIMPVKPILAAVSIALASTAAASAQTQAAATGTYDVSDVALVKSLPGFTSSFATVNDIRLHYVAGGEGSPVLLLPGWPETWWAYHKVMPALVDQLGYEKVDVVGHDIGAMVAFSMAANHAGQVRRLVMLDVAHPSAGYLKLPLLPGIGTFGDKIDEDHPYLWWFAFHQVRGLPEELLEGRAGLEQEWFFRYMLKDEGAIDARDRAVYAAAYSSRDAIRAGNGWYQAFPQDIVDDGIYQTLTMPVLGLGGPGYSRLKANLETKAPGSRTFRIQGSGHFIAEEKPAVLLSYLHDFLD